MDAKRESVGFASKPDFEALARNIAQIMQESVSVMLAYSHKGRMQKKVVRATHQIEEAINILGKVVEYWLQDPHRMVEAHKQLSNDLLELWSRTLRRFSGEEVAPLIPKDPQDRRFKDPQWHEHPFFDFLRQAYEISAQWAQDLVEAADLDPFTKDKARFYLRQLASALSPSNFPITNPEVICEAIRTNGESLVRGLKMLTQDIEAGEGELKIRQSDHSKFTMGVNMAATKGDVIYRNDIMELIQYAPATKKVYRRPLLMVSPWINKFYVLDLTQEKSFIHWVVSQGFTVFMISWVNPDARLAHKTFEDYMREGVFEALEAIKTVTGEREVSALGYCVGGTLLAVAMAYLALKHDHRIAQATFFTTQLDFVDSGDLRLFVDEAHLRAVEEQMSEQGYLPGCAMTNLFNALRPNDLVWSYIVNNYLKGKEPPAFDILTWNADATRMPAANHAFYLRHFYLENELALGKLRIGGKRLNVRRIRAPIYNLATKEDYIAPAKSVYKGCRLLGGDVRFVLAGSGHVGGVINPVASQKYQFWAGPDAKHLTFEEWQEHATQTKGSWWQDWRDWSARHAPEQIPAREVGAGGLAPLCPAPGEYVRVKSA